ncbi:MAG: site-specific DNA-methyltransferase [Phycisphaerales bacterium]|nr:site-specific DNA-methyltransferase [Phycisphaerales bacterium]
MSTAALDIKVRAGEMKLIAQADVHRLPLEQDSVDMVVGSPPYPDKGKRYCEGWPPLKSCEWVDWMLRATKECLRVSKGPVLWVVNNTRANNQHIPSVEMLVVRLYDAGILLDRPVIWHKNAAPTRSQWFSNVYEQIIACRKRPLPHWDWESIGGTPKYSAGGRFRQRDQKGKRRMGGDYPTVAVTRPKDVMYVTVGGGHLGHPLAHENEAPFPEKLIEPFVKALCPVGGIVLDPFGGSGTTAAVATRLGRKALSFDLRMDQCELARRRIE